MAVNINKTYMSCALHNSLSSHNDLAVISYVRKQARNHNITDANLNIFFNVSGEKDIYFEDTLVAIKIPKTIISFEKGIVIDAENMHPA